MFGLMKPRGCGGGAVQSARHRRMHYCGTCKTMGRLYGQRSRLLLNNDAVFLAELLTALGPDQGSVSGWSRAIQSYNCASLPANDAEMPLALQFAAASTLVMSEMKLKDHIADSNSSGMRMIGRLYTDAFYRAAKHLAEWGVPMDELWSWYKQQEERERMAAGPASAEVSLLEELSAPTAEMTALVFRHGAAAIQLGAAVQDRMHLLGRLFGSLIYLIDAYEDDRKDARRGEFNALHSALGTAGQPLAADERSRAAALIQDAAARVQLVIRELPLPAPVAGLYCERVVANVNEKLGQIGTCCSSRAVSAPSPRPSRWRTAVDSASRLTAQHRAECAGFFGSIKVPFIYGLVLLTALVLPRQAMSAASYRELVGVLFNLMFWGAAFNALLTLPQRLLPAHRVVLPAPPVMLMDGGIPHSSSGGTHQTTVVTRTRVRRPCCCANCDWDCCCYNCCDACQCACCTMEACDCASCACDSCSGC